MNQATVTFLRTILSVAAVAVLSYVAHQTNLPDVFGPTWGWVISAIATAALAALDHQMSPAGKVAFGAIGRNR